MLWGLPAAHLNTARLAASSVLHRRTVPSAEELSSSCWSGVKSTPNTAPVWPLRNAAAGPSDVCPSRAPSTALYMRTEESANPPATHTALIEEALFQELDTYELIVDGYVKAQMNRKTVQGCCMTTASFIEI